MKQLLFLSFLLFGSLLLTSWELWDKSVDASTVTEEKEWGFFGHRKINRMAVFTLPPELIGFYKKHIEYITEHAVDPDKRRYATKHEAVRHYMDLDNWGKPPFDQLPRDWGTALLFHTRYQIINNNGDTTEVDLTNDIFPKFEKGMKREDIEQIRYTQNRARGFYARNVLNQYYEDQWLVSCDSFHQFLFDLELPIDECASIIAYEGLSEHGILPYNLQRMYRRLINAFAVKDVKRILQTSADLGHYIGDAHVPLHTTKNYNGQLTNQLGIHAFWESRIPELFANQEFDFFVGKAKYIEKTQTYFWDVVLDSHELVDSVLLIEKRLSQQFAEDQRFCFEERLERTIRTQCTAYARAYDQAMRGMVEKRMRDAVLSLGSVWYSAWADAGQPDLSGEIIALEEMIDDELERRYRAGEAKGRVHGNQ